MKSEEFVSKMLCKKDRQVMSRLLEDYIFVKRPKYSEKQADFNKSSKKYREKQIRISVAISADLWDKCNKQNIESLLTSAVVSTVSAVSAVVSTADTVIKQVYIDKNFKDKLDALPGTTLSGKIRNLLLHS